MSKRDNVDTQCLNVICSLFIVFLISENRFVDSFFLPPKLTSLLALEEGEIKSKRGRKVEGYIEGEG